MPFLVCWYCCFPCTSRGIKVYHHGWGQGWEFGEQYGDSFLPGVSLNSLQREHVSRVAADNFIMP